MSKFDKIAVETASLCIKHEHAAMLEMQNILKDEQILLVSGNIQELSSITVRKSMIVANITNLYKNRVDSLKMLGSSSGDVDDILLLKKMGEHETSKNLESLLNATQIAKEINRINGILITKHLAKNSLAVQVIQNKNNHNLYGPDGQASGRLLSRGISA